MALWRLLFFLSSASLSCTTFENPFSVNTGATAIFRIPIRQRSCAAFSNGQAVVCIGEGIPINDQMPLTKGKSVNPVKQSSGGRLHPFRIRRHRRATDANGTGPQFDHKECL